MECVPIDFSKFKMQIILFNEHILCRDPFCLLSLPRRLSAMVETCTRKLERLLSCKSIEIRCL